MLVIATPKGRPLLQCLQSLGLVGMVAYHNPKSRSLVLTTSATEVQVVTLTSSDIPFSISQHSSDIGLVGSDVLNESCHPLTSHPFRSASCFLAVALTSDTRTPSWKLRLATKYPRTTKRFVGSAAQISLTKLNGAIEAAPALSLADAVTDIVSSGATLEANDLSVHKKVGPVTLCITLSSKSSNQKFPMIRPAVALLRYSSLFLLGC